jgi:sulfite exporter TauE/SafE
MILWTGLLLGFLSSFHCVGMCGPIALAVGGTKSKKFLSNKILYHLGRSLTYALLGGIVGSLGFSLSLTMIQQSVTIFAGVLVIGFSFGYKTADRLGTLPFLSGFVTYLKSSLGQRLRSGSSNAYFSTGLINGFLPCGLVYLALMVAIGLQNPLMGAAYLFFFGLGTIPMLLALMLSPDFLPAAKRQWIQKTIPYLGILIGLLMVFRGLGLGIPGISPNLPSSNSTVATAELAACH